MNLNCLTNTLGFEKIRPVQATALDLLLSALIRERWTDFEAAKKIYKILIDYRPVSREAQIARERLSVMDILIAEKHLYERIDKQARQVLSCIGMNIADSPVISQLLLDAGAIDMTNQKAPLIPLKADYVERCLDLVPREFPGDPGPNSFGTGGTPLFYYTNGNKILRPATGSEFEEIVRVAASWSGVVEIFSVPVQTEKVFSDFDCAMCTAKGFPGLKMISTRKMTDEQASYLSGKEDWLDGTSLMSTLSLMPSMVKPFIRSVKTGNNLLLLDFSIAGASAPNSPEALLTMIHAQVLFMMVLVQTIRPGIICVHGGIPGLTSQNGDLSYSSPSQALINEAMARLNLWVTGFPSAQSGGSTSISDDLQTAIDESQLARNKLRRYGAHMIRHAFGTLGNLQYFSLDKFNEDCKIETNSRNGQKENVIGDMNVLPLYLPQDELAMEAIYELAIKGNPKDTNHTLKNIDTFKKWEKWVEAEEVKSGAEKDSCN